MTRFLPALLVLPFLTACGDKADDTGGGASPWAGNWGGSVAGHAAFEEDWEELAYCTGNLAGSIDEDGLLYATGSCTIDWGPAAGVVFDVGVTGDVAADGSAALTVDLITDEGDRSWETVSASGTASGDALSATGDTTYYSDGAGDVDARVVVSLSR